MTLDIIRVAYGVLLLATLGSTLPHARRYFLGERWGGYGERGWRVELVQNPVVMPLVLALWFGAAAGLIAGWHPVLCAAINLACCHYFFIAMRWRSVLRGMGAPGFIAYWLGAAVFVLELTTRYAPPALAALALSTVQIDFALIMISAGIYKMVSGYRSGHGMELGMVNPEWGYAARWWSRWPPAHPLFRVLDEAAWATEVAGGVLMLVPQTRMIGGIVILLSFIFIATQIRLGFLCEMVVVCCLLFLPMTTTAAGRGAEMPAAIQTMLAASFWTYLILLPVVRAALYYNQLAHKALPPPLQRTLDAYANLFGLIIWRVFTADVVDFFVRIWEQPVTGGARRLVTDYGGFPGVNRFRQVAECITITSVFTTLRYYAGNRQLFVDRVMRYARTIRHEPGAGLVFEWVSVTPRDRFEWTPIAEYCVNVETGTVDETVLGDITSVRAPAAASPVHEGLRPGSYAPARR